MQRISETLQRAVRYQQAGQYREAEAACLEICAVLPNQPDTLQLLAIIYAQTQRYSQANDHFLKAIAVSPSRADFLGNYANALLEQNQIAAAVDYAERSLALNAQQAEVHNILGSAYLAQYRNSLAADSFRRALQLRPQYPHALNNLGNALQKLNQSQEAITCYQRALALQPDYAEACNNLGLTLKSLDRIDEARAHFDKAIQLNPNFTPALQNRAEVGLHWIEPLDGKKLYLRRYEAQDAAYLCRCYQDDVFMLQYNQYIPRNQSVEELAEKLRQSQHKHPCQMQSVDWIILRKDTQQPVGIANLVEIQSVHRRAEFLIGLPDPQDHTRGIALEATLLILDYAFNRIRLNKLASHVYEGNPFSQQSTLALGFVQESFLREHIIDPASGIFFNVYGNGMTQRDFRANARISKLSKRLLGRDIIAAR